MKGWHGHEKQAGGVMLGVRAKYKGKMARTEASSGEVRRVIKRRHERGRQKGLVARTVADSPCLCPGNKHTEVSA